MTTELLEQARRSATFSVVRGVDELSRTPSAAAYFDVGFNHRVLGVCALLLDGDVDRFVAHLAKSGQVRKELLEQVSLGLAAEPVLVCTSKDIFFAAALAASDVATAGALAQLSPQTHFDIEYEEDFLLFHVLHRLVARDPRPTLEQLLARWEALEPAHPVLAACRAIVAHDASALDDAMPKVADAHRARTAKYKQRMNHNPELAVTEGALHVESLALLRIAELHGIQSTFEDPLVPRIARVPAGAPLPPPRSWHLL